MIRLKQLKMCLRVIKGFANPKSPNLYENLLAQTKMTILSRRLTSGYIVVHHTQINSRSNMQLLCT